jgi:hypothetical protein
MTDMPADPFRNLSADGEYELDGDEWRAMRDAMRDAAERGQTLPAVQALSLEELRVILALFILGDRHGWEQVQRLLLDHGTGDG